MLDSRFARLVDRGNRQLQFKRVKTLARHLACTVASSFTAGSSCGDITWPPLSHQMLRTSCPRLKGLQHYGRIFIFVVDQQAFADEVRQLLLIELTEQDTVGTYGAHNSGSRPPFVVSNVMKYINGDLRRIGKDFRLRELQGLSGQSVKRIRVMSEGILLFWIKMVRSTAMWPRQHEDRRVRIKMMVRTGMATKEANIKAKCCVTFHIQVRADIQTVRQE